jgi:hypothetical protein
MRYEYLLENCITCDSIISTLITGSTTSAPCILSALCLPYLTLPKVTAIRVVSNWNTCLRLSCTRCRRPALQDATHAHLLPTSLKVPQGAFPTLENFTREEISVSVCQVHLLTFFFFLFCLPSDAVGHKATPSSTGYRLTSSSTYLLTYSSCTTSRYHLLYLPNS